MPAGVEDGNKLRVKAEGDAGAKGGPVGDLYVFLSVKSHPLFKRTGKDIYSEQKVRGTRDRDLKDELFGLDLYRGRPESGAAGRLSIARSTTARVVEGVQEAADSHVSAEFCAVFAVCAGERAPYEVRGCLW